MAGRPKRRIAAKRWGRANPRKLVGSPTKRFVVAKMPSVSPFSEPYYAVVDTATGQRAVYSKRSDAVKVAADSNRITRSNGKGKKRSMRGKSAASRSYRRSVGREDRRLRSSLGKRASASGRFKKKLPRKLHKSVGTKRRRNPAGDGINDRRSSKHKPMGYVVMTDKFMSGWGGASGGRSLYALAFDTTEEMDHLFLNAEKRKEMKYIRVVKPKANGLPKVTLRAGDQLSITDRANAERWYKHPNRGGF